VGPVPDDRLRLIFTCCHPAFAAEAQFALTLRLIGGLQTPEIARAFLLPEATIAQRLGAAGARDLRREDWLCQPDLAPLCSFDLAPPGVARVW
jgi:predicted RNA polymerase sigma factor